jgi:hypothetical protein
MPLRHLILVAGVAVAFTAPAIAQGGKAAVAAAPPPAMGRVTACRTIAAASERLACFDREVAAMAAAQVKGDLVVMDRQQVRKTRRSLFGLALPDLGVFGDSDAISPDASSIETTIRSARQDPYGKWILDLAEGGRWVQIDSRELADYPRSGLPIRVRRAAFGSYMASINKQVGIRVKRVQ